MARVAQAQCPTCARLYGEKHKATTKVPSIAKMEEWMDKGYARATDGCKVEPDGMCEHGHQSWLLRLGMI